MQGKLAPEVAHHRQPQGQVFDIMLMHSTYEPERLPVNAILVGSAAQSALSEVLGWYRLDWLSGNEKRLWFQPPSEAVEDPEYRAWYEGNEIEGSASINSINGNDVRQVLYGRDSAGEAAVAYACGPFSIRCEPERLEEFWTWWLTEALPKAYFNS